jgi:hypothetical protein
LEGYSTAQSKPSAVEQLFSEVALIEMPGGSSEQEAASGPHPPILGDSFSYRSIFLTFIAVQRNH